MTNFSDLHEDGVDVLTAGDNVMIVGTAWYVDSTHASKSDASGYGTSPDTPFATLDYAIGQASANNGDIIYLAPGHAETKSASGSLWAADVAGVRIVGLGTGADRATFTFSHTGAATTISAASVWLENVLFVCGVDSVTAPLTISAADVTLKDIEFRDAANVEFAAGVITTAAANRLTIDGFKYSGDTASGDACTIGIKLVGVDSGVVKNARFDGIFSTGCIQMVTTACTDMLFENIVFRNVGTAVTKDVVMGVASCTYQVRNCYDGVAGYEIAGSNINPVQWSGTKSLTSTKTLTSIATGATSHFNYIGVVRLIELGLYVTTVIETAATACKYQYQGSTEAAATDLCAALDLTAFDPGSLLRITHDWSDAILGADDVAGLEGEAYASLPTMLYGLAATSAIKLNNAGAGSTGAAVSFVVWEPVTPGAYVTAA